MLQQRLAGPSAEVHVGDGEGSHMVVASRARIRLDSPDDRSAPAQNRYSPKVRYTETTARRRPPRPELAFPLQSPHQKNRRPRTSPDLYATASRESRRQATRGRDARSSSIAGARSLPVAAPLPVLSG